MDVRATPDSRGEGAEAVYDVAISFLARDERLAGEIFARLAETLKVFYFPRAQEQLAGTDGMELMRVPFVSASRVVVILFREPWGQTEWTRLEESAIKDGCLKRGWSTLVFVQLDKTSKIPIWLPHSHVKFALEEYGVEQLIGAIKARVQEHGGTIEKSNAISRARHVAREAQFLTERAQLFRDRAWIERTVHGSIRIAMQRATELVSESGRSMQPATRAGAQDRHCVMTDGRVSVVAGWRQAIFNDVGQEAYVALWEYRGQYLLPGERGTYIHQPEELKERRFMVELTAGRELAWKERGKDELLSTEELANQIAMAFFDLIGKANRGEIEMPFL